MKKREAGFTLIEIIVALVMVGIMSVFAGLFMTTFLDGYFMAKDNADTALKAQMALDRISMELKDISPVSEDIPKPVSALTANSLITYTNSSGVNKTIKYEGSTIYLSTPAPEPVNNILIDHVQDFQLTAAYANVYDIVANDVAFIDIGFTISGYDPFSTRIFPRNRIPHP
jgi:prepilin-type N-terminal cleavage/methylation domain-containing protein